MRQKELRIALVCYGGVSLAVYMHGVTKEIWNLARASRAYHTGDVPPLGSAAVYHSLLGQIESDRGLRLRVLPDILSGASAGGINAVFLAQALHSGCSLEPLTDLWLDNADIDRLVDPDARPMWRYAKFWAQPIAEWVLRRPGNAVSESVAPETRSEVRQKVSRLVRGRWFQPPFSGLGMSKLLYNAFAAMRDKPAEGPLLPPGHPIDLYVTATDFRGYLEMLRLNSPPVVEESEHRMPIAFRGHAQRQGGVPLADPLELTLAARATASFPGAFPPLKLEEIDELAEHDGRIWDNREDFLQRVMPVHVTYGSTSSVSLIDGSVLVNAPFEGAIEGLRGRPAHREVDRRFVYVDPRPDRFGSLKEQDTQPVGFFAAIFGSLSTIPREQPIRDNLEALEAQSREAERLRRIVTGLRPEIEAAVERLFGRTFFLDSPTPKRLVAWRNKAQQAAAERAGYAFQAYAQAKFNGIVERLGELVLEAAPELMQPDARTIVEVLRGELERRGLTSLASESGAGASNEAIAFFRAHDLGFRTRRLRLLARRLSRDWDADPDLDDVALDEARESIYAILSLYFDREGLEHLGDDFGAIAARVLEDPGSVIDAFADRYLLPSVDEQAEEMLAAAMEKMPKNLRRRMLLTYLGFPFYDVATLPLLGHEGLTEFDPVKVDRISPHDATSIREGGTQDTLRGTEFFNFGAFFSRAYRENDYLWGRLHGAERMIDLVCSTLDEPLAESRCQSFKRDAFIAILDEEQEAGRCARGLIEKLRQEVADRLG
ncbi:patatin-like protein [Parerythrobacter jejuensis]|uniref:Patatin-like protein n=1 Tax=Parerythrobacter jejuensis TaxID=795812 RepID=A0A845AV31_9SPHN|nr:patatin-like protein [Parerythrobacter jejuensis]MXP32356.1 patatin-like protein [Parerythrobacter jejuensis]